MSLYQRVKSEWAYLSGALRTLKRLKPIMQAKNSTWCNVSEDLAAQFGDQKALIDAKNSDHFLTYQQFSELANQYARWAIEQNVQKGDTVCLLMPNCPEYMAIWLGIARAGGVTALLNTHLKDKALGHCISIVEPKHIIIDKRLLDAFESAQPHITHMPEPWFYGEDEGQTPSNMRTLLPQIEGYSKDNLNEDERPSLTIEDKCLFIYTSGTTGLPKAANINHYRVQSIMNGFSAATKASAKDIMYICLPMYHTAGGVLATGTVLTSGGNAVIAEKFSSSSFWDDINKHRCTMFQYIGELCRYLVNSDPHPHETGHTIRLISGNGLRPDIWEAFKTRFAIPQILEWYAATEGNAVFLNFDGKVGAVGRIPKWAEKKFVTEVVQFDYDKEEPIRSSQGFCIKADVNEVGEVISQILNDPNKPSQRFEGYADKKATSSKILENVFEKGDRWFRSGDLMRKDALGYFYFVDRIGDTFRWKGENVATSEVAECLTHYKGIKEANVYGVSVKNYDGKVGMATLVTDEHFEIEGLAAYVQKHLPDYAQPLFIRISQQMDVTGTFKIRKVDLVKQGYNPTEINDALYLLVMNEGAERRHYIPLNKDFYDQIEEGVMRL